jgi:hypothetical protein
MSQFLLPTTTLVAPRKKTLKMNQQQDIATQFVNFYYSTFDRNRQELTSLYRIQSMLTFEGLQYQGYEKIVEKLVTLPFQKVVHQIVTIDVQPSSPSVTPQAPILVSVTGRLLVDEEQNPQQLVCENGNYYIFNDIFRLNYGY